MQNYVWKHAQKITTNDSMTAALPPSSAAFPHPGPLQHRHPPPWNISGWRGRGMNYG